MKTAAPFPCSSKKIRGEKMKTILLVDDDSVIRQLLAKLFRKNGFLVAEADGVWSAKQFLETDQAELVCWSRRQTAMFSPRCRLPPTGHRCGKNGNGQRWFRTGKPPRPPPAGGLAPSSQSRSQNTGLLNQSMAVTSRSFLIVKFKYQAPSLKCKYI